MSSAYLSSTAAIAFAKWLRFYKEKNNLSNAELANMGGVSQATIQHVLSGYRKASEKIFNKFFLQLNLDPDTELRPFIKQVLINAGLNEDKKQFEGFFLNKDDKLEYVAPHQVASVALKQMISDFTEKITILEDSLACYRNNKDRNDGDLYNRNSVDLLTSWFRTKIWSKASTFKPPLEFFTEPKNDFYTIWFPWFRITSALQPFQRLITGLYADFDSFKKDLSQICREPFIIENGINKNQPASEAILANYPHKETPGFITIQVKLEMEVIQIEIKIRNGEISGMKKIVGELISIKS